MSPNQYIMMFALLQEILPCCCAQSTSPTPSAATRGRTTSTGSMPNSAVRPSIPLTTYTAMFYSFHPPRTCSLSSPHLSLLRLPVERSLFFFRTPCSESSYLRVLPPLPHPRPNCSLDRAPKARPRSLHRLSRSSYMSERSSIAPLLTG